MRVPTQALDSRPEAIEGVGVEPVTTRRVAKEPVDHTGREDSEVGTDALVELIGELDRPPWWLLIVAVLLLVALILLVAMVRRPGTRRWLRCRTVGEVVAVAGFGQADQQAEGAVDGGAMVHAAGDHRDGVPDLIVVIRLESTLQASAVGDADQAALLASLDQRR